MEDINNSNGNTQDKAIAAKCEKGIRIWNVEIVLSNFALQFAGVLMNGFVISVYLVDILKASPAFIGLISGTAMFQGMLQPFAALITRKIKNRKVFTLTALMLARFVYLTGLIYGYISSRNGTTIFPLVAFLCLTATMVQSLSLELNSWVVDLTNRKNRARKIVIRTMLTNVGAMIGIFMAGIALRKFGSEEAFPVIFIIAIVTFVVAFLTMMNVYDPPRASKMDTPMKEVFAPALRNKDYIKFLSVVAMSNLGVYSTMPFFNTFYIEYLHIPYDMLGYINTLSVIVLALGSLSWGYIIPIVGGRMLAKMNILLLAIIPLSWIILPVEKSIATSLPVILLYSFAQSGWQMAQFHVTYNIGEEEHSTAYISMYFATVAFCAFIAPNISGLLVEAYGAGRFFIPNVHIDDAGNFAIGEISLASPFMVTFILSCVINVICIIVYPSYRINKERSNLRLRDVMLRTDSISMMYKLTISSLIPSFIANRRKLASDLGATKTVIVLPKLISMLDDLEQSVRLEAIEAIGQIPDKEASDILIEYSEKANILEQQAIVEALGNFHDENTIEFLKKMYTSKFSVLRMSAANALRKDENEEIKNLAISYVTTKKYNEEEFMGHLIILAANKAYETITHIMRQYKKVKISRHKEEILYYLSMMFDTEKDYYNSYNDDHIKSARRNIGKLMETMFELEELKEDKKQKIEFDAFFKQMLISVSAEETLSFATKSSRILDFISSRTEKEKIKAIKYFLESKTLLPHEVNFLTICLAHILREGMEKPKVIKNNKAPRLDAIKNIFKK